MVIGLNGRLPLNTVGNLQSRDFQTITQTTTAAATPLNFNYAIIAVGVVLVGTSIAWVVSARHWFKGPKVQGSAEDLAKIEAELAAVGS